MKETALYQALNASVTGCQPSDHWKSHLVRQIVKGEEMKKRTKVSFGIVIAVILVLISAVALAVGMIVQSRNQKNHEYYGKVVGMEQSGALSRWNLEDKIDFISAMRECDFEMDPELYRQVSDPSLPAEQREAAADRIIDNTYGELIREQLGYYIVEEEDSLGVAPDPVIVFEERYLAEHPEGIETHDQVREYTDALGYFLRDEYLPAYENTQDGLEELLPDLPEIDEAYAVQRLRDEMTEVLGWDPEAVAEMVPTVEWDEKYLMWTVSGEVSKESMANVTDMRRGLEPSLSGLGVAETETGYRATILLDSHGNLSMNTLDKEEFAREHQDEIIPVVTIDMKQATALAEQALRDRYGFSQEDVRIYFCKPTPVGTDGSNNLVYRMDFCNHYAVDVERIYGAVINMGTGTAEAVFSYRPEGENIWALLEYAAERELKEGRYIQWTPESKQELTAKIRNCGLLPEHVYWETENPAAEQTDAFVAEAFGRKGYPSAVNVTGMAEALMGPTDTWNYEAAARMEYIAEKYYIRTDAVDPAPPDHPEEISSSEAGQIVRTAVCRAWGMPDTAMDGWETVAQLTQTNTDQGGIALYRVFLTRPDSELGLDTFGGKDNFNYRISLDGEILDSTVDPMWFSPAEDAERWKR